MKKWLFSKKGTILGPFELDAANDFVRANPEVYAWHPSYSHWMPVTCVSEFEDSIPAPKPPSIIPKELIEEFVGEERKLIDRLEQLDQHLELTDKSLLVLNNEILAFKDVAQNCTAEVKATLKSIELQFANLSKNLSNFKSTVIKGSENLTLISDEFNDRLEKDKQASVEIPQKNSTIKINSPIVKNGVLNNLVDNVAKANIDNTKALSTNNTKNQITQININVGSTTIQSTKPQQSNMVMDKAEAEVAVIEPEIMDSVEELAQRGEKTVDVKTLEHTPNVGDKEESKRAKISKIEFSDQPSVEDLCLSAQLKQIDKPITLESPNIAKPIQSVVGEFDHILYDSLESQSEEIEGDKGKKRLRRRRRR